MKKIVLIGVILLLSVTTVKSQVLISLLFGDKLNTGKIEFGLTGGLNFSDMRGISEAKTQNNWMLGFYFDFLLKEQSPWYLSTGVYVKSAVGATNIPLDYAGNRVINDTVYEGFVTGKGSVEKVFNTFYVPINLKYATKSGIFFEAGAQIGLVFKTRDLYQAEVNDYPLEYQVVKGVYNNGLYKWFDGGVDGGIGYKFKKSCMKVGVWYYVGLTNIYKNDMGVKAYNSSLYALVTIPIGKKKAEKAKAAKAAAAKKNE